MLFINIIEFHSLIFTYLKVEYIFKILHAFYFTQNFPNLQYLLCVIYVLYDKKVYYY